MTRPDPFADGALVLAGAVGTTLRARGATFGAPLHSAIVSAERGALVAKLHADAVAAGADVLATNTFTVTPGACQAAGVNLDELVGTAVTQARAAGPRYVVGSIGPVSREPAALTEVIDALARHGVDAILAETMHDLPHLRAAMTATRACPLPTWLSLAVDERGAMLDGTTLAAVWGELHDQVALVAANCFALEHSAVVAHALAETADRTGIPWGLWPNASARVEGEWVEDAIGPEQFEAAACGWLEMRSAPALIGSCCGSTPRWTAAIRRAVDSSALSERSPPSQLS